MCPPASLSIVYATRNQGQFFTVSPLESLARYREPGEATAYSNNYFEIFWITRGSGRLRLDLRRYAIGDGQLFGARPGEMRELVAEEELTGYVIAFTKAFPGISDTDLDVVYPGGIYSLFRPAPVGVKSEFAGDMAIILERLLKEYNNMDLFRLEL